MSPHSKAGFSGDKLVTNRNLGKNFYFALRPAWLENVGWRLKHQ
jgi:hypothetical protein